jgi:hypothetical protein
MRAEVLRGTKADIAESVARMAGDVCEAIVFVEDCGQQAEPSGEDIFAEMEPFTVKAGGADYSRQALYTPVEGE